MRRAPERAVRRAAVLTLFLALALPATAQASSFDTASLTKLPGKVRVSASFHFQAPECVPDEYGYYAYECETGDLVYRVARRVNYVWRGVYSESAFAYTSSYLEGASEVTRLYYSSFRGYFRYAFTPGSQCFRYRVRVTLVDSFPSTSNPSLYFRACH
jgi:hypothetical protein